MEEKMLRRNRRRRAIRLALAVILLLGAACAEEGGELFGDAEKDHVVDDETTFDEAEVFEDPESFEGEEVVVRATVDEVIVPGLLLLEYDDRVLLVSADPEATDPLQEQDAAHVGAVVQRFDFDEIEAEFPDAAGHATLEQYESTSVLKANEIFELDERTDR